MTRSLFFALCAALALLTAGSVRADSALMDLTDGGAVRATDNLYAVREGADVRVQTGSAAARDTGTDTGDVVQLVDVGGVAGLPAVDGSQLTGIAGGSMTYPAAGLAVSTGTAWATSATDNSANWNTAYGWGNHASAGYLTSATLPYATATAQGAVKVGTGLAISATGVLSATGTGSGSGTVNTGDTGQIAYYSATGTAVGGASPSILSVTATGSTASRPLSQRFKDSYSLKDWGAACDGTTDDTTAINAAISAVSSAGGGRLTFTGTCLASQIVLKRLVLLDGGNVGGSTLKQKNSSNTDFIVSENFSTLTGTGARYGDDPNVPSWFGLKDLVVDGNKANNTTGRCAAWYGPGQFTYGTVIFDNCAADPSNATAGTNAAFYTEGTGSADAGWQSLEESFFQNVIVRYSGGRGWLYRGPMDGYIGRYIGAFNHDWSFYNEFNDYYVGNIDYIEHIHTYGTDNGKGQYYGANVDVGHAMSDGDNVVIDTSANFASILNNNCGNGGLTCTTVLADYVTIGAWGGGEAPWEEWNTNTIMLDWQGNNGVLMAGSMGGQDFTRAYTVLKATGSYNRLNLTCSSVDFTGATCANIDAYHTTANIISYYSDTALTYDGSGNRSNRVTLTAKTYEGQTALDGEAGPSDIFSVQTFSDTFAGVGYEKLLPGTATAPSLVIGENNTGLFSSTSGVLGLTASGSGVATLNASGVFSVPSVTISGITGSTQCLHVNSSGVVSGTGSDCGSSGGMTYPGAGVANSTGSAWGTSYTVGTAANNLVQLTASGYLPAVNGSLLTNVTAAALNGAATITSGNILVTTATATTFRGDLVATTATATTFRGNLVATSATATNFYGPLTGNVTGTASGNCAPTEIDGHAAASPSAASLKCGATIYNYGQAASNVNITLPAAEANLAFVADVGTAQASNYWRFTAGTAGTMCLAGTCGKDYVQFAAPAAGNSLVCNTYKTGASSYGWNCYARSGTASTN